MARILYLHGVSGGGGKAEMLRRALPDHLVEAPLFPFSAGASLGSKLGSFASWVDQAEEAASQGPVDLVVGSSLGGAIALALAERRTEQVPLLLLAPVWNTKLKKEGIKGLARMAGPLGRAAGMASPLLGMLAASWFGFNPPRKCPPRTLVIHSTHDELFDIDQSCALLAGSGLVHATDKAWADSIASRMGAQGFQPDPADRRLYPVGEGHRLDDFRATNTLAEACRAILDVSIGGA